MRAFNEYQHDRVYMVFKNLSPCALDENSLRIGRVNPYAAGGYFGQFKMMQK